MLVLLPVGARSGVDMAKTPSRLVIYLLAATGCAASPDQDRTDPGFRVDYIDMAADGVPHLVRGDFGQVALATSADAMPAALQGLLPAIADTMRVPVDQLTPWRSVRDDLGMTHVTYQQVKNGLPVV